MVLDRVFSSIRRKRDSKVSSNGDFAGTSNGASNGTVNGTANGAANGAANGTAPKSNGFLGHIKRKSTTGDYQGALSHKYPDPPDHGKDPSAMEGIKALEDLVSHAMRPLPEQTGSGEYIHDESQIHASKWKELRSIGLKDIKTLKDQIAAGSGPIDDNTMLMERVIQLVADLPDKSALRSDLTNKFVDTLFTSLQHPPLSYLSDDFKYRSADGSNNNFMFPKLGAANTPYARTVAPESVQPGALPDPGLIFDAVLARNGPFRPHPNRNSSIIFYWASLVIHDLFQTDHTNFANSKTSSYLDLSTLYGDTQDDQDKIRTFKDGLLKPDCFSESRLTAFPPGCGVLLIMFNRFHNYVAKQLAAINEHGRFNQPRPDLPDEAAKKAWAKYDNDLFQTARLVTCGLYMNITLIDYVRTIVNLNRSNTTWTLDPRVKMSDTAFNDKGTPRGTGNQVSAEFSIVYRWHPAVSQRDEAWMEDLFKKMFGKPAEELSMPEMLAGLHKYEMTMPEDPHDRPFAGLKRGADGKFSDDDLVEIISDSIEDCAGAFGANHVPKCMRAISILGQQQARKWEMCTLNEFRKFFGLTTHKTFEDINPDPQVAANLKHLYEHPDRVELFSGLYSEKSKEPMTEKEGGPVGVGISPPYTISRAILSDAVALVRGDRFYTIDYHPKALTNWGYTEVQYNFNIEQGCSFSKLFLRAFPEHFNANSIYAHHPMTIPDENRKIMKNLGREFQYSYDRPKRKPGRVIVQNYHAVRQVLETPDNYKMMVADQFEYLMGKPGRDFMLCGDLPLHANQKRVMREALYHDKWQKSIKDFYEHITLKLLKEKSCKIAGVNQIDFTRDVGNLAHIHFVSNVFSLPLKTAESPRGVYSEHELYMVMAVIFAFLFFDVDPVKTFELSQGAYTVTKQLGALVEANVKFVSKTGWLSGITESRHQHEAPLGDYGVHMVRRLLESGMELHELVWSQIIPTAGAMVANQAQVISQILDYYLNDGKQHWAEIVHLAHQDTPEADLKILKYAMEGMRINGTFGGYRRATQAAELDDAGFAGKIKVRPEDTVFVSFVKASRDPNVFPDPLEVKLDRDLDLYLNYGVGTHQCLGKDASQIAMQSMLKVVAKSLKNVRPAPGAQGQLKKVARDDGFYAYMTEDWGRFFPFPMTWKLHFDGELPEAK